MPIIGQRCRELRITDSNKIWRIIYRTDPDAVLILEIFAKKTEKTSDRVIANCKKRIKDYDSA